MKNAFTLKLRNRFQALAEAQDIELETTQVNETWQQIKDIYETSSEECLGFKQGRKMKRWIKPETWKVIEERRLLKKKIIDTKSERLQERHKINYRELDKRVKRMTRADKREYLEDLAKQAEEAAEKGEQGKIYKITRQICGKYQRTSDIPIKDKNGRLLTTESEQKTRWAEHFKEILNRPPPEEEAIINEAVIDLEIDTSTPNIQEIITAIKSLKNGKSPGQDNLNAELFKVDPELAAKILYPLFTIIWEGTVIPDDWTKGIIIKLAKKGTLSDCNNWRGITLLSVPSKIMAKIIILRLVDAIDKQLREEQAGFRKGRGCIDQIFALRNIIEQCTEWQRKLFINFVDFQKAFDSLNRKCLWKILRYYGIPSKIVELIKSFYNNFTCSVGHDNIWFAVETGVRQGCVMSALLFNLAIDWIMRRTTEDTQRGIRWSITSTLEDLDFADDIALLSHTNNHLQEKTSRLSRFASQIGLKISQTKSEVMTLNVTNPTSIHVDGKDIPITETFTYLGSTVRNDGGAGNDIKNRLNKARNIFCSFNNIWKSSQYSKKTKLKLYSSCVLSTLSYGSECWRMTELDLTKLSVFHTKCLRRILHIFWPRKVSNEELLSQCNQENMATILLRRRWKWIGHVLRREKNSITRTALHWTPEGKRKRGRPKNTWRRTVEGEMKEMNNTWGTVEKNG